MNENQLSKIHSAVSLVIRQIEPQIRADASKCDEMRYPRELVGKTNPNDPPPPSRKLSPRQVVAARMLVAGRTACCVARELGVHVSSVFRWKNDPRFRVEVDRVAREWTVLPDHLVVPTRPQPIRVHRPPELDPLDDDSLDDFVPTEEDRRIVQQLMAISDRAIAEVQAKQMVERASKRDETR